MFLFVCFSMQESGSRSLDMSDKHSATETHPWPPQSEVTRNLNLYNISTFQALACSKGWERRIGEGEREGKRKGS